MSSEATTSPLDKILEGSMRLFAPLLTNQSLDYVSGLIFAGFLFVILAISVFVPSYGYDLVAYLGTAFAALGGDTAQSHSSAWSAIQSGLPPEAYQDLSTNHPYNVRQANDAEAFASIQPLYSVKIGYVALLSMFGPIFGWIKTAYWANHLAGFVLGLFSLFWLAKTRSLQAAPIVIAVLLFCNYLDATRVPSPDTIATLGIVAALYLWKQDKEIPAAALLLIAFAFRPDTIILIFALLLMALLCGLRKSPILVLFGTTLVASIVIQKVQGHPGWWTHYYFSNVQIQETLTGFSPAFSLFDFVKGQARGIFMSLVDFNWPAVLLSLLMMTAALVKAGYQFKLRQRAIFGAAILTIGGKFLVFPLPDDRLYLAFLLVIALALCEVWRPTLGTDLSANRDTKPNP